VSLAERGARVRIERRPAMTDIGGQNIIPGIPKSFPVGDVSKKTAKLAGKVPERVDAGLLPQAPQTSLRARLIEISVRAEAVQRSAGAIRKALEALSSIEDTIRFARDAAEEARSARGLPDGAVSTLQGQVDLAINCVDCLASKAQFGGQDLFTGDCCLEVDGERVRLPRLSSQTLGTTAGMGWDYAFRAGRVEYSQSIASASSGGPNSLAFWADGATEALAAGLDRVQELKGALERFYEKQILPRVSDLAVTMANALASDSREGDLDRVMEMLGEVRREFHRSAPDGPSAERAGSVLRLLQ